MKTLAIYLANVLLFAIPLGMFEVYLERFKGKKWNGEFTDTFWGEQINIRLIDRFCEKTYVTPYHLIMFCGIFPGITALEWIGLHQLAGHGWLIVSFAGMTIIPPIFLAAVLIGNMVVEDILWAVFNSYCWWFAFRFKDGLQRYCRGELAWHTK